MDISDDGRKLDPEWVEAGNNVYGFFSAAAMPPRWPKHFVRAGWSSRSSPWHSYEVETDWCQLEVIPIEDPNVLLNGVVDPQRFDELDSELRRLRLRYSLELYEGGGTLVRESQA